MRLSPTNDQTLPCQLDHGIQCFLKHLYPPPSWAAHYSFCEEIPHDIQSESALLEFETIASHPVTGCLGETSPHLATTSFQGVVQ